MGTRADFYVGRGENAEWLGSIAWDGYPDGIPSEIKNAKSEAEFRSAVTLFSKNRDDWTSTDMGWPWPWDDSRTTDYAYAIDENQVWASCLGRKWFDPLIEQPENDDDNSKEIFPNMKDKQNVTMGPRSGVIVIVR